MCPAKIDTGLPAVVVAGEVLWDVFDDSERLGGAPLNFAAWAHRLGHRVHLLSALGADERGLRARAEIASLGLDTRPLQTAPELPTGTASVRLDRSGSAEFVIDRPAAYDAIELSERDLVCLTDLEPGWLYFGTLLPSMPNGERLLRRLIEALPGALRFYDLNLRPGAEAPELVTALLGVADVVKLNESELRRVSEFTGLPAGIQPFCGQASDRFGWRAVAVTRGEEGSVLCLDGEFAEAAVVPVRVVDTVGAGDAFAAALLHGLSRGSTAEEIVSFANAAAAEVVARGASLPAR